MDTMMILVLPLLTVLLPIFFMIVIYYPVRKTDGVVTIGYPIFCKKYDLSSSTFKLQVQRFSSLRHSSWAVVIRIYQRNTEMEIGKHVLPGYMRQRRAEKELKKVEEIIFS